MTWDYQECFILYSQYKQYLLNSLGISQLDYYEDRTVLLPYFTQITKYLNERLIILATDDIKTKVTEILLIFEHGADLICSEATLDLSHEVGIPSGDQEFSRDRFVFAWTNALTSLCMRLKFQYSYLFEPEYDGTCCKCGATGETNEDYESWTSGVYPNDECYDRTNYFRTNSPWTTTTTRYCECYRHSSNDE